MGAKHFLQRPGYTPLRPDAAESSRDRLRWMPWGYPGGIQTDANKHWTRTTGRPHHRMMSVYGVCGVDYRANTAAGPAAGKIGTSQLLDSTMLAEARQVVELNKIAPMASGGDSGTTCDTGELISDGGFESGTAPAWTPTAASFVIDDVSLVAS